MSEEQAYYTDFDPEDSEEETAEPNHALRRERETRGWSQKRLAMELLSRWPDVGVTEKTIGRWERGKRTPGPFYREKLILIFGKSAAELGFPVAEANSENFRLTPEQVALLQELLALGDIPMTHLDPAKRKTLETLIKVIGTTTAAGSLTFANMEPWERLFQAKEHPEALNRTTLSTFQEVLAQCWQLSNTGELAVAENLLSSFLPEVLTGTHNEQTAFLASQGLRLQSILIHHRLNISDKVRLCEQSVEYARQSKDANTLVAALVELAAAYEFSGQTEKWFRTLLEAIYHCDQASPLNQAHAYSYSAVAFAKHRRHREAQMYIQMAFETFPDDPMLDPDYALADSSIFTLSYHAGLVFLETNRLGDALKGFERYKQHPSGLLVPERIRLEILNGQSKAVIRKNDLEQYADLLDDAAASALALGSKKRFDEAFTIFREEVPLSWLTNRRIRDLAEKYHLEREK